MDLVFCTTTGASTCFRRSMARVPFTALCGDLFKPEIFKVVEMAELDLQREVYGLREDGLAAGVVILIPRIYGVVQPARLRTGMHQSCNC